MTEFDAQKLMLRWKGQCRTRDGREAIVHMFYDGQTQAPLQGAILDRSGYTPWHWNADGKSKPGGTGTPGSDLMMPDAIVAEVWVPYDSTGLGFRYSDRGEAVETLDLKLTEE